MATEILATGTTAANSSEVTVTAGTPITVSMKDAAGIGAVPSDALLIIKLKDDAGAFFEVGRLTAQFPAQVLVGPGVYKLSRPADRGACGAFSV